MSFRHKGAPFPLEAAQAYFTEHDIPVRRGRTINDAYFDVSTSAGKVSVRFWFDEPNDLLIICASATDRIPYDRMSDAAQLISRINHRSFAGSFLTLDPEEGEVAARAIISLASRIAIPNVIADLVASAVDMVVEAVPVLPGVGLGNGRAAPTFFAQQFQDIN